MRVVLDANILIAAYAARGLCEAVLEYCINTDDIFLTEEILTDVKDKLIKKIKLPHSDADKIIQFLRYYTTIVEADQVPKSICRDPDDVNILGAAHTANADYSITGDDDLLVLKKFGSTKIVKPRTYWEEQTKSKE